MEDVFSLVSKILFPLPWERGRVRGTLKNAHPFSPLASHKGEDEVLASDNVELALYYQRFYTFQNYCFGQA